MIGALNITRNVGRYPTMIIKNYLVSSPMYYHKVFKRNIGKLAEYKKNTFLVMGLKIVPNTKSLLSTFHKASGIKMIVKHDSYKQRFYVDMEGGGSAYIEYEKRDRLIILKHTFVSKELSGRGLGKLLAKEALKYVAQHDLQLEMQCPFLRVYVSQYEPKYIKYIEK